MRTRIQEGAGGRVKVKAYLGGALGDEISTLDRCKRGHIQLWGGTAGALADKIPELACLELPYLFPSLNAADEILDTHLWDVLDKLLLKRGFKLICYSENGHRSIGANFGFVKSVADLKGKKMRSQPGFVHSNTWQALGASPVPVPVTETLTALQTGVVDGFDNTELFTFAASWHQTITHFTATEHSYQPGFVIMSKLAWDPLPSDIKALILGDRKDEAKQGRAGVRALKPMLVQNFSNAGIHYHKSTSAERAAFAKATAKTHDKFKKKYGDSLLKIIKKHVSVGRVIGRVRMTRIVKEGALFEDRAFGG